MTAPTDPVSSPSRSRWTFVAGYVLLLAATVTVFYLVRAYGESVVGREPRTTVSPAESAAGRDDIYHILLALAAIVVACQLAGRLFAWLGQPRVIGEVVAGILLGPSLLGQLSPAAMEFLLPARTAPILQVIAQLGVILYMFLVGLELNAEVLRGRAHQTVVIAHAGIAAPFVLGVVLALWLYADQAPAGVSFTSFALFLGISLSVTAFPVLARILRDRRLEKTPLGLLSLGCAAVGDVSAWCLLALVVGITRAEVSGALVTVVLAAVYLTAMFVVAMPAAHQYLGRLPPERLNTGLVAWILVALLLSAWATEAIGIHAIFGAFALGAVIPQDSAVARLFTHKLEDIVTILLLPAFFAFTGMRTQIGLVTGLDAWLVCGVIVVAATVGKFGGTVAAARWAGLDWDLSTNLGILMNTRGLMELIVLNVGLDMKVISPTLFTMLVLMALATTILTGPALQVFAATRRRTARAVEAVTSVTTTADRAAE